MVHLSQNNLHCALVVDKKARHVVGLLTPRDIVRYLVRQRGQKSVAGRVVKADADDFPALSLFMRGSTNADTLGSARLKSALGHTIDKVMTPTERVVFSLPSDSANKCKEIMFQLRIRNMPVIEKGVVLGIVNLRDIIDAGFDLQGRGLSITMMMIMTMYMSMSMMLFFCVCMLSKE